MVMSKKHIIQFVAAAIIIVIGSLILFFINNDSDNSKNNTTQVRQVDLSLPSEINVVGLTVPRVDEVSVDESAQRASYRVDNNDDTFFINVTKRALQDGDIDSTQTSSQLQDEFRVNLEGVFQTSGATYQIIDEQLITVQDGVYEFRGSYVYTNPDGSESQNTYIVVVDSTQNVKHDFSFEAARFTGQERLDAAYQILQSAKEGFGV